MPTQLIYVSAATVTFSPQDLATLLLKSRANNQRLGVTGLLIHHTGSFFQVLEGQQETVETLFQRISRDKRHTRVLTLVKTIAAERVFGSWSMGFVEGSKSEFARLPGFADFFRRGFEQANAIATAARAKELALAFRDGRFRQHVEGY